MRLANAITETAAIKRYLVRIMGSLREFGFVASHFPADLL